MITQIDIKDLRGIAQGSLSELTQLTILTGVNGSGKSTVLDALLIGADPFASTVIPQVINRRASRQFTGEWLFRSRQGAATVSVVQAAQASLEVLLRWVPRADLPAGRTPQPIAAIESVVRNRGFSPRRASQLVMFHDREAPTHEADFDVRTVQPQRTNVRLIDMRGFVADARDLTEVLTEAKTAGFGTSTVELLAAVIPGIKNLEILRVGDGYEVGAVFDSGAVPLSMSGDGVRGLTRLALELASLPNGLALLEEPEVHQHPGAIRQSASAIAQAVKRGLQVVVATHSLELIDHLILSMSRLDLLSLLSVKNLRLTNGKLEAASFSGLESEKMRNAIGTELR